MSKLFLDFGIQTDQLFMARRTDLEIVYNSKKKKKEKKKKEKRENLPNSGLCCPDRP